MNFYKDLQTVLIFTDIGSTYPDSNEQVQHNARAECYEMIELNYPLLMPEKDNLIIEVDHNASKKLGLVVLKYKMVNGFEDKLKELYPEYAI